MENQQIQILLYHEWLERAIEDGIFEDIGDDEKNW
jgi:hypothetical protein